MLFKKLHFCQKTTLLCVETIHRCKPWYSDGNPSQNVYFNVKIHRQNFFYFKIFLLQSIPSIKITFFVPFDHLGHEIISCTYSNGSPRKLHAN